MNVSHESPPKKEQELSKENKYCTMFHLVSCDVILSYVLFKLVPPMREKNLSFQRYHTTRDRSIVIFFFILFFRLVKTQIDLQLLHVSRSK